MNLSEPEPPPKHGEKIVVDELIKDIQDRKTFGYGKYGTYLMSNNGRNAIVDMYQELLDALIYCKQILIETENGKNM